MLHPRLSGVNQVFKQRNVRRWNSSCVEKRIVKRRRYLRLPQLFTKIFFFPFFSPPSLRVEMFRNEHFNIETQESDSNLAERRKEKKKKKKKKKKEDFFVSQCATKWRCTCSKCLPSFVEFPPFTGKCIPSTVVVSSRTKLFFQSKGNENSVPLKFPAFQASFFCLFITGVVSLNCDDWFGQHPLEVLPRTLSNNNKHRPRLLTTHTQKY